MFMAPSILLATMARHFVTKFFEQYVSTGCVIFKEEDGTVFTFKGNMDKCPLTVVLKVHNPQFYFKVMTQPHHLGFADAYGERDFSCEDEEDGLLNLFQIFTAIREYGSSPSGLNVQKRGWGASAELFKAIVASAKYLRVQPFLMMRERQNPAKGPNVIGESIKLFTDETMQISCPIYKAEGEDPKVAHMRKMSSLISKARIEEGHQVLEIGCGWGRLGIEIVKRTGCKYTGIELLPKEQLKCAQAKVKEAGFQDKIKFIICDFRKLPRTSKYDRIICCEVVEQLGTDSECLEQFYECCESILAEDGLLVHQFNAVSEKIFDKKISSPGFMNEYVYPSGGFVSLTKMLSAMAAASNLSVEHVENIGPSYHKGFRCYRKKFRENKSKLLALGLSEKTIRQNEYYFVYSEAGYKTGSLRDYQVVFSRPGNTTALGDPYQGFPSAYSC